MQIASTVVRSMFYSRLWHKCITYAGLYTGLPPHMLIFLPLPYKNQLNYWCLGSYSWTTLINTLKEDLRKVLFYQENWITRQWSESQTWSSMYYKGMWVSVQTGFCEATASSVLLLEKWFAWHRLGGCTVPVLAAHQRSWCYENTAQLFRCRFEEHQVRSKETKK